MPNFKACSSNIAQHTIMMRKTTLKGFMKVSFEVIFKRANTGCFVIKINYNKTQMEMKLKKLRTT